MERKKMGLTDFIFELLGCIWELLCTRKKLTIILIVILAIALYVTFFEKA